MELPRFTSAPGAFGRAANCPLAFTEPAASFAVVLLERAGAGANTCSRLRTQAVQAVAAQLRPMSHCAAVARRQLEAW